jgi:rRNA maturation endonuclease Nob1
MEHLNTLHSLCEVLGIDFKQTVHEVHPSLDQTEGSKNLSNTTIDRLASAVNGLRETKIQRMQKVTILPIILEICNVLCIP